MIMMTMMMMMTMMKCEYLNMNITNTMNDTIYSNINVNTDIITIFTSKFQGLDQCHRLCGLLRALTEHQLLAIKIWGYQWIQLINLGKL